MSTFKKEQKKWQNGQTIMFLANSFKKGRIWQILHLKRPNGNPEASWISIPQSWLMKKCWIDQKANLFWRSKNFLLWIQTTRTEWPLKIFFGNIVKCRYNSSKCERFAKDFNIWKTNTLCLFKANFYNEHIYYFQEKRRSILSTSSIFI